MRRLTTALCALALTLALPVTALADHVQGRSGWYVEYNDAGRLVDNYSAKEFAEDVSRLQPGDDITLTVEARQSAEGSADWYISNEVIKSLEDGDASGGAYGYKLAYEGPSGSRTIYSSASVGGIGSTAGLADATNAMDGYLYMGTLSKGETGKVTLNVSLDGETEGNAYFDTLAQLSLKFAVEPQVAGQGNRTGTGTPGGPLTGMMEGTTGPGTTRQRLVQTGDRTSALPLYLVIASLGVVCLALAVRGMHDNGDDGTDDKEDTR